MKNKKISAGTKFAMLGVILGLAAVFFLFSKFTSAMYLSYAPVMLAILVLMIGFFTAFTVRKLYAFYETSVPIKAYIPMVNELALVDYRLARVGVVLYIIAAIFIALGAFSIVPGNLPFTFILIGMIVLLAVQVVKGIGIRGTFKEVAEDWNKISGHDAGIMRLFAICGFLPFVRVLTVYSLDKILTAMVTFGKYSIEDTEGESNALTVSQDKE